MPDPWNDDIVQYAASFTTLSVTAQPPNGDEPKPPKIRVRRSMGDLMHTMGYYFEQNGTKLSGISLRDRLRIASDVIGYIADNLDT